MCTGYYLFLVVPDLFYIWVVMIVIGMLSFVSALLYALVYMCVRLWRLKEPSGESGESPSSTPTASNGAVHRETNGSAASSHLANATDHEEFAWLNVNNLDYEIQSTKNLGKNMSSLTK